MMRTTDDDNDDLRYVVSPVQSTLGAGQLINM